MQINRNIFSGSEPKNEQSFIFLNEIGIKTIISVDGLTPKTAEAQKYNIQYVHIPIGYNGISRQDQLKLKQVLKTMPAPYFIHCHHGIHRGPTAAAIMELIEGHSKEEALAILKKSGTSPAYKGLWQTVKNFQKIDTEKLPSLSAKSKVSPMVSAMVIIDRAYDDLRKEYSAHSKLLLTEGFTEALRVLGSKQSKMRNEMKTSLDQAIELSEKNYFNSLKVIKRQCRDCHHKFRD